jgi:hypothetical protein
MYATFESLAPNSKVWVYQSNRAFTEGEINSLHAALRTFVESWTAHNNQLKGSYLILRNQFIVLAVDESQMNASGCSIDKSVHFMQVIESELGVSLFDRNRFAFEEDQQIVLMTREEFETALHQGRIKSNTRVVNNMVFTKEALEQKWLLPFDESWHARLFSAASMGEGSR